MLKSTVLNDIVKVEGNRYFNADDMQIKECPVSLILDGVKLVSTVITASDDEAKELWTLGYLKCGGLIGEYNDITYMNFDKDNIHARIKNNSVYNICGEPLKVSWRTTPVIIFDAVRRLSNAPLFKATGGTHVAAVFDSKGQMLFEAEDIGRHNAIDKVIGWGLKENVDLSGVMLVTSGRMPKDIVTKSWTAGIGLMASISAASADGVDTAKLANMTLAGFVRVNKMNIYTDSNPNRIEDEVPF